MSPTTCTGTGNKTTEHLSKQNTNQEHNSLMTCNNMTSAILKTWCNDTTKLSKTLHFIFN